MNLSLVLAFLFFMGSVSGWVLELFYRRFFSSANPERKWINPGFCTGPYVPLYGVGLCTMFLLVSLEDKHFIADPFWNRMFMFLAAAIAMTVLEYIAGIICLKLTNVRLWDYSDKPGNIKGIICPQFSAAWTLLTAVYYFLIHPHIIDALSWLSNNLAFSFFIGLFFGIFIIDLAHSTRLLARLRAFAAENDVIVRYENLKAHIRSSQDKAAQKSRFFLPFKSERPLNEHLREMMEDLEKRKPKSRKSR